MGGGRSLSDLTAQNRTLLIRGGLEPKIEMKRKIARQSDLIISLEKNEIRKSTEVDQLRQKINEQEEIIAKLKNETYAKANGSKNNGQRAISISGLGKIDN